MLQEGITPVLQSILSGDGSFSSRSSEQTTEVLALINELIPPLPSGMIPVPILAALSAKPASRISLLRRKRQSEATDRTELQLEAESRVKSITENPHIIVSLAEVCIPRNYPHKEKLIVLLLKSLFDLVIRVYGSTVNPAVRNKCILIIIKVLHFCSAEVLKELLRNIRISSFIATQLGNNEYNISISTSNIHQKLQEIKTSFFAL